MSRRKSEALDRFSGLLFDAGQRLFLHKDIAKVERRGQKFGELAYRIDKKHRLRTISNLSMAFPEWSVAQVEVTAKGVFRHWGLATADFLRTPLRNDEDVTSNIEVEGMEYWEAAQPKGNGTIACTAHLGNFERFGQWAKAIGRPITVVAREANQGAIQTRMEELRKLAGIDFMGRGNAARPIMKKLRENQVVGLLPDQNSDESFLPFFGKPCGTVLGPAVLHIRTKSVMLPAFCVRTGVGKYRVILKEPIDYENVATEPQPLMAAYNLALESVVREYPEQYLWMHDRWKSARKRGLL
jgi:KDO2-lipid IV(A) lauroyltransferase